MLLRLLPVCVLGAIALGASAQTARPDQTKQQEPAPNRPTVCLVLSGGGARGAAHIGVLKVLEEMRIPIDCITGTSMGAVVGAAYASGMTITEMEKLASAITVDALFKEKPPRAENSIRRKQEDFRNLFGFEIGVTDEAQLQFGKGVVSGVQLETLLRKLSRIKGSIDFDLLPIPFRAVATDLVTGTPKVFANGDLALAMRASMSVPGIIAPAEFDGMMLVDGGLVDNLPVGVARSLGADIVIAVNLGTPLMTRKEIRDVLGITGQMIAILTEQNVQQTLASLKPTDILVLPELGNFSAADFDRLGETYAIGEAAARKVADRLAPLAVLPAQYVAWQQERTAPLVADRRPVDEIRFTPGRVNPSYAESLLSTKPGEPLEQSRLDADLLRLYGTGNYEHVSYRLIDSPTQRILNVQAIEKSWGPNYLRFGLGLSSDFQGDAFFNVLAQYRRTWVNELGAEWRTDFALGRNSEVTTEFYQPLDARQRFFVAPRASYQRGYLQIFADQSKVAEYAFPTFTVGADVGGGFTRDGEVRVGAFWGITRNDLLSGSPLLGDEASTRIGGLRLLGSFDRLDNLYFPKGGFAVKGEVLRGLKALGSEVSYDRWDIEGIAAHTWGRHTLQVALRGAGPVSRDDDTPGFLILPWGGFLQQSGFATGQLLNERFAFGRVAYIYKLRDIPLLEGLYTGISAEVGNYGSALVSGNPTGTLYSGAAFLALDSPIGPIYLGYGVGSGSNRSAYFFLGRP